MHNLNQNILWIAGNKTYLRFQPDVVVTYSSTGIVTSLFAILLASGPLVCAKPKIGYILEVDGVKTYLTFRTGSHCDV